MAIFGNVFQEDLLLWDGKYSHSG